jgi:predicted nuclease with TOPRIM domain
MTLTKTDLDDIKKLIVEAVGPMFEAQNETIEKFQVGTRDQLKSLEYEISSVKEFCKILEGKQIALQNDVIEILDRVTSIEKRLLHMAESDIENIKREHASLLSWAKRVSVKTGIKFTI